jgi:hypothetical protein
MGWQGAAKLMKGGIGGTWNVEAIGGGQVWGGVELQSSQEYLYMGFLS